MFEVFNLPEPALCILAFFVGSAEIPPAFFGKDKIPFFSLNYHT